MPNADLPRPVDAPSLNGLPLNESHSVQDANDSGHPKRNAEDTGHPEQNALEPSPTDAGRNGRDDENDSSTATVPKKQFDDLRRGFNKLDIENKKMAAIVKQLEDVGGIDGLITRARQPHVDPEVAELSELFGISPDALTPEKREVAAMLLGVVRKELGKALPKSLHPYDAALKQQEAKVFESEMTKQYPDWKEYAPELGGILKSLPPNTRIAPQHISALYFAARQSRGDLDDYVAKRYRERVETTKSKATSTGMPTPGAKADRTKPKNLAEAFKWAKDDLGLN